MPPALPPLDETFPSLVPPLRSLVEVLAGCLRSGAPLQLATGEIRATNVAMGELREAFERALPWHEFSADDERVVTDACDAFDRLRATMSSLSDAVAANQPEGTSRDVATLAGQVRILEASLARLRESEAGRPALSPVPAVNLLLKAGRAVARRRASWALLAESLDAVQPAWAAVASCGDLPPQAEVHGQALDDLARVVGDEDFEALEAALENVRVSGEALLETGLAAAPPPPEAAAFLCPRCGGAVGPWDRSCPSCNAKMPERIGENTGSPSAWQSEDLPDYVQALFRSAEGLRAGQGDWDGFLAAVVELRRRAVQCLGTLDRVPLPAPGAPRDELETWHASQEAIENGLERFFEGLDALEAFASALDPQLLDRGLEAVLDAVRETRRVGDLVQRLLEDRLASEA